MGIIVSRKTQRLRKRALRTRERLQKRKAQRNNQTDVNTVMDARRSSYAPLRERRESDRRTLDERYKTYTTLEESTFEPIELAAVAPFEGDYRTGQMDMLLEEEFGLDAFPALAFDVLDEVGVGDSTFPIQL